MKTKKFAEFLNEKKKASPAQIAAREKFKEMVAGKKKDKEEKPEEEQEKPEENSKECDCKDDSCDCKPEKKEKKEKKVKKEKKIASFGDHTGGFKP